MPEQLTRHPEVTLQVLRSAGARCGEGAPQQILVKCPAARFCRLPGGEVCVYGLADAPQMTQIAGDDWRALQVALGAPVPAKHSVPLGTLLVAIVLALAAGIVIAGRWHEHRRRLQLRREYERERERRRPAGDP